MKNTEKDVLRNLSEKQKKDNEEKIKKLGRENKREEELIYVKCLVAQMRKSESMYGHLR